LQLCSDGDWVRLLTRNGHDWSAPYPSIVESALKNRSKHFVIDGEAVVLGVDGVADFDALYSRKCDEEVQLYAFDLALDGDDLRALPPSMRKTNLARLLRQRVITLMPRALQISISARQFVRFSKLKQDLLARMLLHR
jgi:ATP-dependent DNA ligase